MFNGEKEGERLGFRLSCPIAMKGLDTSASTTIKEAKYEIVNSVVLQQETGLGWGSVPRQALFCELAERRRYEGGACERDDVSYDNTAD